MYGSTMQRLLWVALAIGCSASGDERELDARFVTQAVLAPSCGAAACHSTFKQAAGNVFDTLSGMRQSIVDFGLISLDSLQFDPADPANARLIVWVTQTDPFRRGVGRMPLDAPLADSDVEYLKRWIVGPTEVRDDQAPCSRTIACAEPDAICHFDAADEVTGRCISVTYLAPARGAQCNPSSFNGLACNNRTLVRCNSDWNFGEVEQVCASDCTQGACL